MLAAIFDTVTAGGEGGRRPGASFVATPRVTLVPSAVGATTPSREPVTLPVFPEEVAVMAAAPLPPLCQRVCAKVC